MYPLLRMKDLTGIILILLFFSETRSFIQESYTRGYPCSGADEIFIDSINTNYRKVCPLECDLVSQENESNSKSVRQFSIHEKRNSGNPTIVKENFSTTLRAERVVPSPANFRVDRDIHSERMRLKVRDNQIIRRGFDSQGPRYSERQRIDMGRELIRRKHQKMRSSGERQSFRTEAGKRRDNLIVNVSYRIFDDERANPRIVSSRQMGNERSSGEVFTSLITEIRKHYSISSRRHSFEKTMHLVHHLKKSKISDKPEARIHRFGNDRRQRENHREFENKIRHTDDLLSIRATRANSEQRDLSLRSIRNVRLSTPDFRRKNLGISAEHSPTIRTHLRSPNYGLDRRTFSGSVREDLAEYRTAKAITKYENQQINLSSARNLRNFKLFTTQRYVKPVYSIEISDLQDTPIEFNRRSRRIHIGESRNIFTTRQTRGTEMEEAISFRSRLQRFKHSETRNKSLKRDFDRIELFSQDVHSQISRQFNEMETTAKDNSRRVRLIQDTSQSHPRELSDLEDTNIEHNRRSRRLHIRGPSNISIARQIRAREIAEVRSFRKTLQRSKHSENKKKSLRRDNDKIKHLSREENSQIPRQFNEIETDCIDVSRRVRLIQDTSRSSSNSQSSYGGQIAADIRRPTRDNSRSSNKVNISSQRYSTSRISSERSRIRPETVMIYSSKFNEDLGAKRISQVKSALNLKNINTRDSSIPRNVNREQSRDGSLSNKISQTDHLQRKQLKKYKLTYSQETISRGPADNQESYLKDRIREIATNSRHRENLEPSRYSGNSVYNIQQLSRSKGKTIKTMLKDDQSSTGQWLGVIQISFAAIILGQLIFNEEKNNNRAFAMSFLKKLKNY